MRRAAALLAGAALLADLAGATALLAACGGAGQQPGRAQRPPRRTSTEQITVALPSVAAPQPPAPRPRPKPRPIATLAAAHRSGVFGWTAAVRVRGALAASIARVPAAGEQGPTVTLLRLDQRYLTVALHAGATQPGGFGWRYGPLIEPAERRRLVAAFTGGFQESYGAGGFALDGRVGWPLKRGEASIVTYRDGTSEIGRWQTGGFPRAGAPLASVRQNLPQLLIDGGAIPPSVDTCVKQCWGDPLHEQPLTARSALGIDAAGRLIWAGGLELSVRALAEAMKGHGARRAIELDINPAWVAGYVYAHARHHNTVAPVALAPGQADVDGAFLSAYWRDFFTVLARPGPGSH